MPLSDYGGMGGPGGAPDVASGFTGPAMPGGGNPAVPNSGSGHNWKDILKMLLPVAGGAVAGGFGGLAGLSGFASSFANEKYRQAREQKEQDFQVEKALGDQAHQTWQELSQLDLSQLGPEHAGIKTQLEGLNKAYIDALSADSPGGPKITAKESQQIIALGAVAKRLAPQVQQANADRQYTHQQELKQSAEQQPAIAGIEQNIMADAGVDRSEFGQMSTPPEELHRLAKAQFDQDAYARQQYETPQETEYGYMTPKDQLAQRGQDVRALIAQQQAAAQEARFQQGLEHQDARAAQRDAIASGREDRRDARFFNMPVPVQTVDEAGNPVTKFVQRSELMKGEGPMFDRPLPNAERVKAKEADSALQQLEELGRLYQPEYVGPGTGRAYAFGEHLPDFGQIDPMRSAFTAQNAAIKNSTIKLITGAQMSASEADRILKQVPVETDPPKVWEAKYQQTLKNSRVLRDVQAGKLNPEVARKELGLEALRLTPPPVGAAGTAPASSGGGPSTVPPGMKLQRNKRTGETRLVPIS